MNLWWISEFPITQIYLAFRQKSFRFFQFLEKICYETKEYIYNRIINGGKLFLSNFPAKILNFFINYIYYSKKCYFFVNYEKDFFFQSGTISNFQKNFNLSENYFFKKKKDLNYFSFKKIFQIFFFLKKKWVLISLILNFLDISFQRHQQLEGEAFSFFFVSERIIFKIYRIGISKHKNFFYKHLKIIFLWLKNKYNSKRFFALSILENNLISGNFNKSNQDRGAKKDTPKNLRVKIPEKGSIKNLRRSQTSPSSYRSYITCLIKLTNLLRDFYVQIRKKCEKVLISITKKKIYSESAIFFSFRKLNFANLCDKGNIFDNFQIKTRKNYLKNFCYKNPRKGKKNMYLRKKILSNFKNQKTIEEEGLFNSEYVFLSKKILENLHFIKNDINIKKVVIFEIEIWESLLFFYRKKNSTASNNFYNQNSFEFPKIWNNYKFKYMMNLIFKSKNKDKFDSDENKILVKSFSFFLQKIIEKKKFFTRIFSSVILNMCGNEINKIHDTIELENKFKKKDFSINRNNFLKNLEKKNNILRIKTYSFLFKSLPNFVPNFAISMFGFFKKRLLKSPIFFITETVNFLKTYFKIKDRKKISKNLKITENNSIFLILSRILIQNTRRERKIWKSSFEYFLFSQFNLSLSFSLFFSRILNELIFKTKNSFFGVRKQFREKIFSILSFFLISHNQEICFGGIFFSGKDIAQKFDLIQKKKETKIKFDKLSKIKKERSLVKLLDHLARPLEAKTNNHEFLKISCFLKIIVCHENILGRYFKYFLFLISKNFSFEILSEILISSVEIIHNFPHIFAEKFKEICRLFSKNSSKVIKSSVIFFLSSIFKGVLKSKKDLWEFLFSSSQKKIYVFSKKRIFFNEIFSCKDSVKNYSFIDFIPYLMKSTGITELFFRSLVSIFIQSIRQATNNSYFMDKMFFWFKIIKEKISYRKLLSLVSNFFLTESYLTRLISQLKKNRFTTRDKKIKNDLIKALLKRRKNKNICKNLKQIIEKLIYLNCI